MIEDRLIKRITDIFDTHPYMKVHLVCVDIEEYQDVFHYLEMHGSKNLAAMAFDQAVAQLSLDCLTNVAVRLRSNVIGIVHSSPYPYEVFYLSFKTADYLRAKASEQKPIEKHHYGCHNKPRPISDTALEVQSGWRDVNLVAPGQHLTMPLRVPHMVTVPFVMTEACMYDKSNSDPACYGCFHRRA